MIDAIGDVLSDRPMTRVEVVDAVVARVSRPHLREDMLTGWGTFLGPAAQRGRLVFGPSEGRNVAFVDPSEWLGRPIGARTRRARGGRRAGPADRALPRGLPGLEPGDDRPLVGRPRTAGDARR